MEGGKGVRWIIVGVLVFAVAFAIGFIYTRSIRTTVSVPVAKTDIGARTQITEAMITDADVPKKFVTGQVETDKKKILGQYTTGNIWSGQPFYKKQLAKNADYIADVLPNERALALELTLPAGVGGTIQAGDRVDIIAVGDDGAFTLTQNTLVLLSGTPQTSTKSSQSTSSDNKQQTASEKQQTTTSGSKMIVLISVTPENAEKIVFASASSNSGNNNGVYLTRDPFQFVPATALPGATPATVFAPQPNTYVPTPTTPTPGK